MTTESASDDGTLEFEVLDVFTSARFAGNPLAVVLGADELGTAQLQALAREFNLSETAFPMAPPAGSPADYRLRIFTPATELPFAGHPSVGTAWLMAARGRVRPGRVVQACGAGDLPLLVEPDGGRVTLTGGTPTTAALPDVEAALRAVGLGVQDLLPGAAAGIAGTGLAFAYVLVRLEALGRVAVDPRALSAVTRGLGGLYLVAWGGDGTARTRMLASDIGVAEDPATGSAALGLAVHAVAAGLLAGEGTSRLTVHQGVEMGRPSLLHLEVDAAGGSAVSARVAGDVVPVSRGRIAVPR
jgi:trans-2,3-dihydro-3-hydroxyanthranilate isomerase